MAQIKVYSAVTCPFAHRTRLVLQEKGIDFDLIEIDLLRQGQRVPMQQPLPPAPYFVFVSRAERRPIIEVWPIQLNMRLPAIPVPLQAEDAEVTLDLQLALNTIYDTLNYDLIIDYTQPPQPPLEGDEAIWTSELLREAGINRA